MAPLASKADLVVRIGRDLTCEEETRVEALLGDASTLVRSYTGQDFAATENAQVTLRAQGGLLRLPQRPVVAVSAVVAIGRPGTPDIALADWWFDGIDLISIGNGDYIINLPEQWWDDEEGWPGTFRITYSYGSDTIPPDVVTVVAGMVLRTLTSPAVAGGVTSETIGPYSYRTDAPGLGLSVVLTDLERKALARYRRNTGMISVRAG